MSSIKLTSKLKQQNIHIPSFNVSNQFQYNEDSLEQLQKIDKLLQKNEIISKNLKQHVKGINQSDQNIAANLNQIRPFTYNTKNSIYSNQVSMNSTGSINNIKNLNNISNKDNKDNMKSMNNTNSMNKTNNMNNLNSMNNINSMNNRNSIKRYNNQIVTNIQSNEQSMNNNNNNSIHSIASTVHKASQAYSSSPIRNEKKSYDSIKRLNISNKQYFIKKPITQQISLSEQDSIQSLSNFNKTNKYYQHQSQLNDNYVSQLFNRTYLYRGFQHLEKRRNQIQNIYLQLRKEEQLIERAYRQYRKSYIQDNSLQSQGSTSGNQRVLSSPNQRTLRNSNQTILSNRQQKSSLSNTNQKKSIDSKKQYKQDQKGQKLQVSGVNYITQQSHQIIEQKQDLSSFIFIPFNKLYKSPILSQKNASTVILARQSKVTPITSQQRIIDGKKYKFYQQIESDQQQLIRILLKDTHARLGIVGGKSTLKKKIHLSLINSILDKILHVVYQQKYHQLIIYLSYTEFKDKSVHPNVLIQDKIQINQSSSIKPCVLKLQKKIQQICETIHRPQNSLNSNSKNQNQNQKSNKFMRQTKIELCTQKDSICSYQIISINQIKAQFIRNLCLRQVVWMINPLIKNYDQVAKTLNQATKYQQLITKST